MSLSSSALIDTQLVSPFAGYSAARVFNTVAICAQGAAQGAWKEITRRVDEESAATCDRHSSSVVISFIVDIVENEWL